MKPMAKHNLKAVVFRCPMRWWILIFSSFEFPPPQLRTGQTSWWRWCKRSWGYQRPIQAVFLLTRSRGCSHFNNVHCISQTQLASVEVSLTIPMVIFETNTVWPHSKLLPGRVGLCCGNISVLSEKTCSHLKHVRNVITKMKDAKITNPLPQISQT